MTARRPTPTPTTHPTNWSCAVKANHNHDYAVPVLLGDPGEDLRPCRAPETCPAQRRTDERRAARQRRRWLAAVQAALIGGAGTVRGAEQAVREQAREEAAEEHEERTGRPPTDAGLTDRMMCTS